MEMVSQYNRLNKIGRLHYITLQSVVSRIGNYYAGRVKDFTNMEKMKQDLIDEMRSRHLDRFFQLELIASKHSSSIEIKVHEINMYNQPKECVTWNW